MINDFNWLLYFINFSHYNKIIQNGQYLTNGKIISINSFRKQLEKTY
jgi:hypothetical protein